MGNIISKNWKCHIKYASGAVYRVADKCFEVTLRKKMSEKQRAAVDRDIERWMEMGFIQDTAEATQPTEIEPTDPNWAAE